VRAQTHVAPDQLENEEPHASFQPRHWLRTVHFRAQAVRAAVPPNSSHHNAGEDLGRGDGIETSSPGWNPGAWPGHATPAQRIATTWDCLYKVSPRRSLHLPLCHLCSDGSSPGRGNINRSKSCAPRLPVQARATRNKDACSKVRIRNCGGSYGWDSWGDPLVVAGTWPAYGRVRTWSQPLGFCYEKRTSLGGSFEEVLLLRGWRR
jgi:hypothetical protein